MAKAKSTSTTSTFRSKTKAKRPGIHSKKKSSRGKNTTNYKKAYKGQGR
jgi:hypothetical protein